MEIQFTSLLLPAFDTYDWTTGSINMETSTDPQAGHEQGSQMARDMVKFEEPTSMSGSYSDKGTSSNVTDNTIGVPGQDYESYWGIDVTAKIVKKPN